MPKQLVEDRPEQPDILLQTHFGDELLGTTADLLFDPSEPVRGERHPPGTEVDLVYAFYSHAVDVSRHSYDLRASMKQWLLSSDAFAEMDTGSSVAEMLSWQVHRDRDEVEAGLWNIVLSSSTFEQRKQSPTAEYVGALFADRLASIPQVVAVGVGASGRAFDVTVIIEEYDMDICDQIFAHESQLCRHLPSSEFDFRVLARAGRSLAQMLSADSQDFFWSRE